MSGIVDRVGSGTFAIAGPGEGSLSNYRVVIAPVLQRQLPSLRREGDYSRGRISDACDAKIAPTSARGWWICSTNSAIRGVITSRY
jgi:hypothetical protein